MTDVDALLQIASAIRDLASSIGGLGFILLLFLLFKNMGGTTVHSSNDGLRGVANAIEKLVNKIK